MGLGKASRIKIYCDCDIVFCIDCSFSMIPIIESIKESISLLMNGLVNDDNSIDWRARVVGFRDNIVYDKPFVTTVDEIKTQLDSIKAQGIVEDEQSPVIETLERAVKDSSWRECTRRVIMMFTDTVPKTDKCENIDNLSNEMDIHHITLYLWGKKDSGYNSVYDLLAKIPRADIVRFEDPIEFYYHKYIKFEYFMSLFLMT